ncbi:MAG: type II toxin-antitoxin system VapC family toxin [Euryarchaeota archaeon]|nr:type II toxin-antitoxin system VapC family toxin [Euryarchaeota archaeon]
MDNPKYVVDTVALTRYFGGDLPGEAGKLFERAEKGQVTLLLPSIVVGEFLALGLNGRLDTRNPRIVLEQVVKGMETSPVFTPAELDYEGWQIFLHLDVPDLHDRMLVALATANKAVAILSNNPTLKRAYRTEW